MSSRVRICFPASRGDLRPVLAAAFARCDRVRIAVGFASPQGIRELATLLPLSAIEWFIFGHGGRAALAAADDLGRRIGRQRVRIHPGYALGSEASARARPIYRPMMHSKLYLGTSESGAYSGFIGSQNITAFALEGLNAEAGVLLDGLQSDPECVAIEAALSQVYSESQPFDPALIEEYAGWHKCILEGLSEEEDEQGPGWGYLPVIVLMAALDTGRTPKPGETLYFEVPQAYTGRFVRNESPIDIWVFPYVKHPVLGESDVPLLIGGRLTTTSLTPYEPSIAGTIGGSPITISQVNWIIRDFEHPIMEPYPGGGSPPPAKAGQVLIKFDSVGLGLYDAKDPREVRYTHRPWVPRFPTPILGKQLEAERELRTGVSGNGDQGNLRDPRPNLGHDFEELDSRAWYLVTGFKPLPRTNREDQRITLSSFSDALRSARLSGEVFGEEGELRLLFFHKLRPVSRRILVQPPARRDERNRL